MAAIVMATAAGFGWSPPLQAAGESPAIAYRLHCTGCHLEDGSGSKMGGIPPIPGLAGHFLKHEKGRLYLAHVPGLVNAGLPDEETARLLNYVIEVWGANDAPVNWERFTGEELKRLRSVTVHDIAGLRKEIAAELAKQGIDLRY